MATKKKSQEEVKARKVYSVTFKKEAVRLHEIEGLSYSEVARKLGVHDSTIKDWCQKVRKQGEEGLKPSMSAGRPSKTGAGEVKQKVLEIKKAQPWDGVKTISQKLAHWFGLKASSETVRKMLHEEGLMEKAAPNPPKNMSKPRRFERSSPNQMWQSDIMTIKLGGQWAHLIGFMDDYSRFMVSWSLLRSATADAVIETFRPGTVDYGIPKEVLTDNGRQYANWRGTSKFAGVLAKDRIAHIRSAAHHPMTLGKIERFWETVNAEFWGRVQFESFEAAIERLRHYMAYYNHSKPHQGIGGVRPADRFFEVSGELRKVIEATMADNELELALRGKPREPFYMVGRTGDKTLYLTQEKGKIKMSISSGKDPLAQPQILEVGESQTLEINHEKQNTETIQPHTQRQPRAAEAHAQAGGRALQPDGQSPGGSLDLEPEQEPERGLPGDGLNWMVLEQWQQKALSGMLQALEPARGKEFKEALPERLQNLLEKATAPKIKKVFKEIESGTADA